MGTPLSVATGQPLPPCPGLPQPPSHQGCSPHISLTAGRHLSWANHAINPNVTCATTSVLPTASLVPVTVTHLRPRPWLTMEKCGELPLPTAAGTFQFPGKMGWGTGWGYLICPVEH